MIKRLKNREPAKLVALLLCSVISSCAAVYPKFSENQNETCDLVTKKLTLDIVYTENTTNDLEAKLFSVIVTGVVSGSIAIAGNTAYWLEEFGSCDKSEVDDALSIFEASIQELGGWFSSSK
jgi:hypothetical protein